MASFFAHAGRSLAAVVLLVGSAWARPYTVTTTDLGGVRTSLRAEVVKSRVRLSLMRGAQKHTFLLSRADWARLQKASERAAQQVVRAKEDESGLETVQGKLRLRWVQSQSEGSLLALEDDQLQLQLFLDPKDWNAYKGLLRSVQSELAASRS